MYFLHEREIFRKKSGPEKTCQVRKFTHVVPVTLSLCVTWVLAPWKSLDNPKSAILATILSSSNILAGFKSR